MKHTASSSTARKAPPACASTSISPQRADIEVLRIDPERRKDAAERARLLNAADVAFLCLPDAAAREAAALVNNPRTCLIDASTAHRTAPGWAFGLPELAPGQRDASAPPSASPIPAATRAAFILLLRPLVMPAWCRATAGQATSITGYSGGGKKMIARVRGPRARRRPTPRWPRRAPTRSTLAHKHLPEMMAHTGLLAAGLRADRRHLLQGSGGQCALASFAAPPRHHGAAACTRRCCSATPASASSA